MQNAQNFIRALQLVAGSHADPVLAHKRAISKFGPTSGVAKITQKWASSNDIDSPELRASYREILALARRRSLVGRIQEAIGFRRVPFEVPVLVQADGTVAGFIGEGDVIPAGSLDFTEQKLPSRKVAGILPCSKEFASLLDAGATLSGDLTRAIADAESSRFYSDEAGTDAAPAGILQGLTPATGSDDPVDDIARLIDGFDGDLSASVVVTSPTNGARLNPYFESAGARGGEVAGIAHATHHSVPNNSIAIVQPERIMLGDGGLLIDVSTETTLSPEGSNDSVALWQTNAVAFRVQRFINWLPADGSVRVMTGIDWAPEAT